MGSNNDPDVVSNSQPLINADPNQKRLVMTYDQAWDLVAWLDTFDPDWYCARDFTGRLKGLKENQKLRECVLLAQINPG